MKKKVILALSAMMLLTGCGNISHDSITPVSREDGSGTRGAFVELFDIQEKDENGEKMDMTTDMAEITNSTAVMLLTVTGNKNAIGYISLGSLSNDVKAVSVDGVAATVDNINNGTYKVSRPFNIAVKEDLSELAADFIAFIMSDEGQAIIEEKGYIQVQSNGAYTPCGLQGTIVVAGSTSVAPVMEVLADKYKELNSGVTIEIQQTGSSAGMTSTINGACDIGMASREVKESELAEGLIPTVIAMDGIAVIVNNDSSVTNLTSEQIKGIYTGEITDWNDVK